MILTSDSGRWGLVQTDAPGSEPFDLATAKAHLRVDGTDDDALITALIVAARGRAESETRRALVTQKWRLSLDAFPSGEDMSIELPRPPLQSVEGITYLDDDGVRQTLASSSYQVITDEAIGRVLPAYDSTWPSARCVPGSIQISYTAGYGAASAVPQAIKQWMLLLIAGMYENREDVAAGVQFSPLPYADRLLDPYRLWSI